MSAHEALEAPHGVVVPLLDWGEANRRDLPWRRTRDPWHVLVSEVMLQQTQVERVVDRYLEFLARFPRPGDCAAAGSGAVIELWTGLGYNRRAVNLWRCAVALTERHDGELPDDLEALLELPGVGPYTARAVLAFAFERDVGVVDTNVGRLLARWTGQSLRPSQAQTVADALTPTGSGWAWNQTLFDFAVAVCTKRTPACTNCPLNEVCAWGGDGPDPATRSAGVSGRQSRFEGSERQVRGRIVEVLRRGPIDLDRLGELGRADDSAADVRRLAEALVRDGLIEIEAGRLRLPDGTSAVT